MRCYYGPHAKEPIKPSQSERKFRTLLETAPIPLVLVADGKYVYANERTYDLLDRGPKLMADRTQAKQIVLNLLSNAIKYTTAGTTIDIHLGLEASGELALRIIDQGPGIPVEDIERILEPFTRLEGTHTSRVEGSGLGLAIAKSLVEGHGGRLKLVSEVDRGTEAIVIFPAGRVKQDTE